MAYRIYHVEGIVLQSKPTGEGDALLFVYTKELGLVFVVAKSLRLARSRLRFVLQRFAHAHLDLVRGKHGWRLTSARTIDTQSTLFRHPYRKKALAAMASMLLRLIQGEEPHPELYMIIFQELERLRALDSAVDCHLFELHAAMTILRSLGYWEDLPGDPLVPAAQEEFGRYLLAIEKERSRLIPRINTALRATHL